MPKAAMNQESRTEARALCQSRFDLAARMVDYSRLEDAQYAPETVARLRPAIRREALQRLSDDIRDAAIASGAGSGSDPDGG